MPKNNKLINYGKQSIDDYDIEAVIRTLKSDFITPTKKIPLFEDAIKIIVELNTALL